ncbi:MAG: hypothetical protein IKD77_00880 [Bacilli bacterium]|nr:hypothetical protein [Bacilli bacterium]
MFMGIAFLMLIGAFGLQINNELDNANLSRQSLEVVAQIDEIFDQYLADEDTERIKKLDIDGTTYIGVLSIPSLNNMSLRSY